MKNLIFAFLLLFAMIAMNTPTCFSQSSSWLFREVYSQKTNGVFASVQFAPAGVPRLAATWVQIIQRSPLQMETRTFIYDFPSMDSVDTFNNLSASRAFTRDGKYLAMSFFTEGAVEIQLWGYGQSGLPLRRLNLGENSLVYSMTTSRDDRYLYLAGEGGVRIVDLSQEPLAIVDTLMQWFTGTSMNRLGAANDVALSHSGDFLVSVSGSREAIAGMKKWDASTHELVWERTPDTLGAYSVCWSPDDSKLLMIVRDPNADFVRLEERSPIDGSLQTHVWDFDVYEAPQDLGYIAGGEYIVVGCLDNRIRAWDTKTLKFTEEFRPHDTIYSMDVSPDGRYIATCGSDSILRVFEVTTASSVSEPVAGESSVRLSAPRPNPARDVVDVPFQLSHSGEIELMLMDLQGRKIRDVASGIYAPGNHRERIETEDLPSGVYYVVLRVGGEHHVQPVQIIR